MEKVKVDVPTIMHLEVCVMPNGEIICSGKSIGFTDKLGQFLSAAKGEK